MESLDDASRLRALRDVVLRHDRDPVLQELLEELVVRTSAPIGLVSMVLGRTQLWLAATGLPPDLEASRASSRRDSYCQLVVARRSMLRICDNGDAACGYLPADLCQRYGIRAYLGVPIFRGNEVLGSLCLLDGEPHEWTDDEEIAVRVAVPRIQERLEEIAGAAARHASPSPEPVAVRHAEMHRRLVELGPLVRLAEATLEGCVAPDEMARGLASLEELVGLYDEIVDASLTVRRALRASEPRAASVARPPAGDAG